MTPGTATDAERASVKAILVSLATPVEQIMRASGVSPAASGFRAVEAVWSVLTAVDAGELDLKEILQWTGPKYSP